MRRLIFEPAVPMPLWVVLACVALALGLAYVFYRPPEISRLRRCVVMALWYMGVAAPLVLLLNPSWLIEAPMSRQRPRLKVLLDTSQSMGTADMDGKSRLSRAAADFMRARPDLANAFDVEPFVFDDAPRPLTATDLTGIPATGEVTDISGAIQAAVQGMEERSGALLLLSDGADNGSENPDAALAAASLAQALGTPIFTMTYGTEESGRDISVEMAAPRELAFVSQKVVVTAIARQKGFAGALAGVSLYDGKTLLQRKEASLAGERTPVTFEVVRDKPGVYLYELEVDSAAQEITRLNNRATFTLTVVDDAIKVLVLEGKPYWDSKFLVRTLERDKAVAVTAAVRLSEKRVLVRETLRLPPKGSTTAPDAARPADAGEGSEKTEIVKAAGGFLADADDLRKYQIVILGRDAEAFLTDTAVANLKQWIAETGGTLVCARGKPEPVISERLDAVMPVSWGAESEKRVRLKLTPFGRTLCWLPQDPAGGDETVAGKMPSLSAGAVSGEIRPLTSVIARGDSAEEAEGMPVMTYRPHGAGRTLVLEGSGMWRWAFLSPKQKAYSEVYDYFWGSLLRWMISSTDFLPSQTCAVKSARAAFTTRDKVVIFAMTKPQEEEFGAANPPVIELSAEGQADVKVLASAPVGKEMGLFKIVTGPLPRGSYQARLKRSSDGPAAECVFQVQPPLQEQVDVAARPALMARIASDSGGVSLAGKGLGEIQSAYTAYWVKTHPDESRHMTAWDKLWILTLTVVLWSFAWVVRRRGGLI